MAGKIVLLATNSPEKWRKLETLICSWRALPMCVPSAADAITLCSKHEGRGWKSVDIIFTDLAFSTHPEIDGLALCETARVTRPDLPVVVLSEPRSAQFYTDCKALGASEVLFEPVEDAEMQRVFEELTRNVLPV